MTGASGPTTGRPAHPGVGAGAAGSAVGLAAVPGLVSGLAPGQVPRRGLLWGAFACVPLGLLAGLLVAFLVAPAPLAAFLQEVTADPVSAIVLYLFAGAGHCVAFVWHAARNPRLNGPARARWVMALAAASGVAAPMYWWRGLAGATD